MAKSTTLFKKGNPGKPKGAVTHLAKVMRTVKEVVLDAFNELQKDADANIVTWGKKNPKDFYAIAAKLIPTEIKADVNETQKIINFDPSLLTDDEQRQLIKLAAKGQTNPDTSSE